MTALVSMWLRKMTGYMGCLGMVCVLLLGGCVNLVSESALGEVELGQPGDAGRLSERAQQLQQRIKRRPRRAGLHRELGRVLLAQGKLEEAEAAAEEAWRLEPLRVDNLVVLGQALLGNGNRVRAVEVLNRTLEVSGGDWRTSILLGRVLALQGEWQRAEQALRQAEAQGGRRPLLDEALVETFLETGQLRLAAVRLGALEARPAVWVLRARLQQMHGRPQQSLLILDNGLQKHPRSTCLLEERLDILWRLGNTEKLQAALQAAADSPRSHIHRALLLQAEGKTSQAQNLLQKLYQQQPRHIETLFVLVRFLLQTHQPQQALQTLQQALQENFGSHAATPWLYRMRASAHLSLSQPNPAQQNLEQAERLQPHHAHTRLLRIAVLIQKNQTTQAQNLLSQHLQQAPHDVQAQLLRADLAALSQQPQQVQDILDGIGPLSAPQQIAFIRARQAYLNKQYRQTLRIIQQARSSAPPATPELSVPPWRWDILRALALHESRQTSPAQKTLKPWLYHPATNGWAARTAGDLLHLNNQPAAAQNIYNTALRTFPNHPLLLEGLSRTALARGQKQTARNAINKGLAQTSPWRLLFLERLRFLNQQQSLKKLLQTTVPVQTTHIPSPPPGPLFLSPQTPAPWPRLFHSLQNYCKS